MYFFHSHIFIGKIFYFLRVLVFYSLEVGMSLFSLFIGTPEWSIFKLLFWDLGHFAESAPFHYSSVYTL